MLAEVSGLVKHDITKSPADDDAQRSVKQNVIDIADLPATVRVAAYAPLAQPQQAQKAQQVHEAIPMDAEAADMNGDWVEFWMYKHGGSRPAQVG